MVKEFEATSKEQFASEIRLLARRNGLNLIEAISSYCEDNDVDMEDVIPMLDRNMKEEIRCDAIQHRYVRGQKPVSTLF